MIDKNKQLKNSNWEELYSKHIKEDYKDWLNYYRIKMKLKKPFINLVIKYANNKPILECGCGTAKTTVYLASKGITSYGIDIDKKMVRKTKERINQIYSKLPIKIHEGDIRNIKYKDKFFSVAHSSGVLEHYNDTEIVKIINEQLRIADYCIFSVPTKYFEKKMYGNERLLTKKEWKNIINKSNAEIVKTSNYNYKKLNKRIKDIITKPSRITKPKALFIFVLKERKNK